MKVVGLGTIGSGMVANEWPALNRFTAPSFTIEAILQPAGIEAFTS